MGLVIAMRVAPTALPIELLADFLIRTLRPRHTGGKGPVSRVIGCAFLPLGAGRFSRQMIVGLHGGAYSTAARGAVDLDQPRKSK